MPYGLQVWFVSIQCHAYSISGEELVCYLDTKCHWVYIQGYCFVQYKYLFVNMVSCMCTTTVLLLSSLLPLCCFSLSSLFPFYFLSISLQLHVACGGPWLGACDIACEGTGSIVPFYAPLQASLPFNNGYWPCLCCQQGHRNTHGCMFWKGTLCDKDLTIG